MENAREQAEDLLERLYSNEFALGSYDEKLEIVQEALEHAFEQGSKQALEEDARRLVRTSCT